MGFNPLNALAAVTGFGGGYQQAQAQRKAEDYQLSQAAIQARRALAQQALEQMKLQQTAQDKELDRQQHAADALQTATTAKANQDATAAHNKAMENAANANLYLSALKQFGNNSPYVRRLKQAFNLPDELLVPGDVITPASTNNAAIGEDGTVYNTPDHAAVIAPPLTGDPGEQATLLKTIQGLKQSVVGQGSKAQNAVGETINRLLETAGLPLQPVPFSPSGEVRTVGAKQFPILTPGYAPDPETAARMATTEQTKTETGLLIPKFRNQAAKDAFDRVARKAQLQLTANGQELTRRGQDLTRQRQDKALAHSDAVAVQKQAHDDAAKAEANAKHENDRTQSEITRLTILRDSAAEKERGYRYGATPNDKLANAEHVNWQTYDAQIKGLKANLQPRHPTNGQFVKPATGHRIIKTKSGSELTIE